MPKEKNNSTEYRSNTAVQERTEYEKEKDEKNDYPTENRNNSYQAANQHMVKFADELRGINEDAALNFDRRKNPAEYDLTEKQEMVESVTEAFNAVNWNSANERRQAADDIAQNLYQPMYPRMEIAEAAVQHKVSHEFLDELKKREIEYVDLKDDGTIQFKMNDIEAARELVEKSQGQFYIVSTRNLDYYRDEFADALYASDRQKNAKELMEQSIDKAVRYYNGDVSQINRWEKAVETLLEKQASWEGARGAAEKRSAEGKTGEETEGRTETEGDLEPSYREMTAFRNLESTDEYTLDHTLKDMLNEKLAHTQEYAAELQLAQHPDATAAAQVNEALREMYHEGIQESVEKGNEENFVEIIRSIEGRDEALAKEIREMNGSIRGEDYEQPKRPEHPDNLESISDYAEEVREAIDERRDEMSQLNYDIADKLLERLEQRLQMTGEWEDSSFRPETAEDYRAMGQTMEGLEYVTRPEDPVFWKLNGMGDDELESEIKAMVEGQAAEGTKERVDSGEDPAAWQRTELGLHVLNENVKWEITYAVREGDIQAYREAMERLDSAREYVEILDHQNGEVYVEEVPERPVEFDKPAAGSLEERIQSHLDRSEEFANSYKEALESAEGNSEAVTELAEDLLEYYNQRIEDAREDGKRTDMDCRALDHLADQMLSLIKEKERQPATV